MYEECMPANETAREAMSGRGYTAELKTALRGFLAQCGASCYEDESDKNVLKCYSRLQNGMCVEQEIHVSDTDYVCYTNLSGRADGGEDGALTALVLKVNEVNLRLKYGNFEVEDKRGLIRFRSYYEPGSVIGAEELDRLVGEPLCAIETYGAEILYR